MRRALWAFEETPLQAVLGDKMIQARPYYLLLVACMLLYPYPTVALTLGALQQGSKLGEPLEAFITVWPDASMVDEPLYVQIGDAAAYQRFGLTRSNAIDLMTIVPSRYSAGMNKVVLRVSSSEPIDTPLLELLVVAQTESSKAVRTYSVLLDPAEPVATPEVYRPVRRGDTLWAIAETLKEPGVTTQQMVAALYDHNPDAFEDGSINRMRVGSELTIPTAEQVQAISHEEGLWLVRQSDRERQRLAAARARARAASEAAEEPPAEQSQAADEQRAAGGRLRLEPVASDETVPSPRADEDVSAPVESDAQPEREQPALGAEEAAGVADDAAADDSSGGLIMPQLQQIGRLVDAPTEFPAPAGLAPAETEVITKPHAQHLQGLELVVGFDYKPGNAPFRAEIVELPQAK